MSNQYTPKYSYVRINNTSIPLEGLIVRMEDIEEVAYQFKTIKLLHPLMYKLFKYRAKYVSIHSKNKTSYTIRFYSKIIQEAMSKKYFELNFKTKAEQQSYFDDLMSRFTSTGLVCANVQQRR